MGRQMQMYPLSNLVVEHVFYRVKRPRDGIIAFLNQTLCYTGQATDVTVIGGRYWSSSI